MHGFRSFFVIIAPGNYDQNVVEMAHKYILLYKPYDYLCIVTLSIKKPAPFEVPDLSS